MLNAIDSFLYNDFIFSKRYRVWRHIIFWSLFTTLWAVFWVVVGAPTSFGRNLFNMSLWVPFFILFSYPLMYWAIPQLLLKGKVVQFFLLILAWGVVLLYAHNGFRTHLYIPMQEAMGFSFIPPKGPQAHSYLSVTTTVASPIIMRFFKLWTIKQRDWMQAQQEKITAELQLLKAQVHPHFLFNTLNNIYSFSLENSPKTPGMILKLSSLLGYMLYDCKADEVLLEKEIEVMKNYIDLEKERYGNKIDISLNIEGDIKDKFIAPLLLLPFLENAFKHGTSEQLEKSWLSMDITVKQFTLRCKIANSKNEFVPFSETGIGIQNVKQRLRFLYPGKHELKIADEGAFFVVSILIELVNYKINSAAASPIIISPVTENAAI